MRGGNIITEHRQAPMIYHRGLPVLGNILFNIADVFYLFDELVIRLLPDDRAFC